MEEQAIQASYKSFKLNKEDSLSGKQILRP